MKQHIKALAAAFTACCIFALPACEDSSNVGGSLVQPNVTINVDSNFIITGKSFHQASFDSRAETMLLGALDMKGVGSYNSSVVTQLMAATSLTMPDSIPLDSISGMALKLSYRKGALTGDSLTPCQVKVYQLTKQLPAGIQSNFDPTGYYSNQSLLGYKNYTASVLGLDSAAKKDYFGHIKVDMPIALAHKFVTRYRTDPSVFQWPATFNEYFPGLYIENSFGRGCMVNLTVAEMAVYYQRKKRTTMVINDSVQTVVVSHTDSATIFSTAPEVLSSNNLHMTVDPRITQMADNGKVILMSPCGYLASVHIPAQELVNRYNSTNFDLAVVNNLIFSIPAKSVENNYGLLPPPSLLLVRRCDMNSFFAENRIPDGNKKSFWGSYNSSTGLYTFSSMRQYIVDLIKEGGTVSEEDMDFVLVPISLETETNTLTNTTYVTSCTPYIYQPTLCELDMSKARLCFTFGTKN